MQDRGPAAYLAEFIGTLLLVFFICAVVSLYVVQPSETNPNPFIDFSVIGLVHAFLLFGRQFHHALPRYEDSSLIHITDDMAAGVNCAFSQVYAGLDIAVPAGTGIRARSAARGCRRREARLAGGRDRDPGGNGLDAVVRRHRRGLRSSGSCLGSNW